MLLHSLPGNQKKLRVGFTSPGLAMGGAEWWIISLAENLLSLEPAGVAVLQGEYVHERMLRRCRRRMPVFREGRDGTPREIVQRLAARCDVLISWGWGDIDTLFAGAGVPRIEVSHSAAEFPGAKEFLAKSSGRAHYLAAVSETAKKTFPEKAWPLVKVLPNGCDPNRVLPRLGRQRARAAWQIPEEVFSIVYIGRLNETKRPDLIVSALARLPENYWAIFCGPDQGLRSVIEREAKKYAPGRVAFAPVLEHLGDVLALADVFCSPTKMEGHSLAATEAALAGVPLVTCAIPAVQEIEAKHGSLAWLTSIDCPPAELAGAIVAAATAGRGDERVIRARVVALEHYTISAMAARWESFLHACLADWHSHALQPALAVLA